MALNQKYTEAVHITLPLPYDREPGEAVLVGGFAGVALTGGVKDDVSTVWLDGSWDVTVTGALNPGDTVSITSAGKLTATATGNTPWGLAIGTKGTGDGVVEVAPLGKTVPAVGA